MPNITNQLTTDTVPFTGPPFETNTAIGGITITSIIVVANNAPIVNNIFPIVLTKSPPFLYPYTRVLDLNKKCNKI